MPEGPFSDLRLAQRLSNFAAAHSRALSASFIAVLTGFAVAAFGVAPLLPDPGELPLSLVVESITPDGMRGQLTGTDAAAVTAPNAAATSGRAR